MNNENVSYGITGATASIAAMPFLGITLSDWLLIVSLTGAVLNLAWFTYTRLQVFLAKRKANGG